MQIFDKILSKIRHIQSQTESIKIKYIWTLAMAIFIVIVAVWLIFFKINRPSIGSGANTPISNIQNDMKEKIKSGFGELKNSALPELKNLLKDEGKAKSTDDNSSNPVDNNLK